MATVCRPVEVGGRVGPCPPPPPYFLAKILKKEDCHFTFENTELITQGNSPFDFNKYVVRANFFSCPLTFKFVPTGLAVWIDSM